MDEIARDRAEISPDLASSTSAKHGGVGGGLVRVRARVRARVRLRVRVRVRVQD